MATIDIGEVRRRLETYAVLTAVGGPDVSDLHMLLVADRLLAYLPMLLDELEQLRTEVSHGTGRGVGAADSGR